MNSWDEIFFKMCKLIASKSKDPRTKVGCVIIDGKNHIVKSLGYNGPPRGCDDSKIIGLTHTFVSEEKCIRGKLCHKDRINALPIKYMFWEHAERNAIYNAARIGVALDGCTMYVNQCPCADCARAIIQSGIIKVLIADSFVLSHWKESCDIGYKMMLEAGVEVLNV